MQIKNENIKRFFETRAENNLNFYYHPSYTLEQQLMDCIIRCDHMGAKEVLDQINSLERAKLSSEPLRSLKNSLICSCTLFTRAVIHGGVLPEDAFNLSDVMIRQIEKTDSSNALKELEYEMVNCFIDTLKSTEKLEYNPLVNKAITYIHREIFNDELSLEKIAEFAGVHPAYLSKIFKESIGVIIPEYINRKKIEDSKYFLLHTDSRLSEIAQMLGYCNQSYYTSLFKKYTGMTPRQYKSSFLSKSQDITQEQADFQKRTKNNN
ncbi:helix-turn-helix transcriptional regulator [Bacillus sp. BRMEA1]|uniref:helix-turn-helix domain-containing protein n=1 Tax=Neobacillus endophyticus TaxID=2738405 RepID=UPI0015676390|nr:AraC family transcriptional regulator [Neobacillus endophyticus]NRD76519.1 helix-turn-helix transcriptional regulator [Neobacillus endophyticus]